MYTPRLGWLARIIPRSRSTLPPLPEVGGLQHGALPLSRGHPKQNKKETPRKKEGTNGVGEGWGLPQKNKKKVNKER
jgi:hypothetical protein